MVRYSAAVLRLALAWLFVSHLHGRALRSESCAPDPPIPAGDFLHDQSHDCSMVRCQRQARTCPAPLGSVDDWPVGKHSRRYREGGRDRHPLVCRRDRSRYPPLGAGIRQPRRWGVLSGTPPWEIQRGQTDVTLPPVLGAGGARRRRVGRFDQCYCAASGRGHVHVNDAARRPPELRPAGVHDSYLVDSASSYMLASKIKPCEYPINNVFRPY